MTIKIEKSKFKELYQVACSTWQAKFDEKFKKQIFSEYLEFEESFLEEMKKACDPNQLKTLRRLFKDHLKEDLFSIKTYSEVCKNLGIKELTEKDFKQFDNSRQMLAFHKIKNIEKLFNGDWKPDFSDSSQYKYYPYSEKISGGWRFVVSNYYYYGFCGSCGLFKDKKTSDFVGSTFLDIYLDII